MNRFSPRRDVPLAPYTSFGIGGPARWLVDARSSDELLEAILWGRELDLPLLVLGHGANVLVGDGGFDGLVVRNARARRVEVRDGTTLRAESGVDVGALLHVALARGLSGLEHFAGIPSTLGGALWQNLHFLSPERDRVVFLGELVEAATVLAGDSVERVGRDWFGFGYDRSVLRDGGGIVLDATLRLARGEPAAMRGVVRENLAWRAARHPDRAARRSAGCVFRNPEGASAARLIDAAGLRGTRVGGAAVSRRHANFVVNLGGATASDVRALLALVAERVENVSGVRLEPELSLVGSFASAAAA